MTFVLAKLVETILTPSNVVVLIGVGGILVLVIGFRALGVALLVASTVLLAVLGWSPLGPAALLVLENRFPIPNLPSRVTGIVMLGGAVDTHISTDRHVAALTDGAERIVETAALARRYPDARIILSGGLGALLAGRTRTESEIAKDVLVALGVSAARIELDNRSRNTCENATESAKLAHPKQGDRWLLVTSAYHMPRAVACFRAADFEVIPYPVDYRTRTADLCRPRTSIANGLADADLALHEWLGLIGYRLSRTKEVFPAPQVATGLNGGEPHPSPPHEAQEKARSRQ